MLIALPRALLPHAGRITYFTQSTNVANRPHTSALGEELGAAASDGQGHHDND